MSADVDYERLSVPEDKPPAEYTYTERRTEIYQLMQEAGHPKNLNQTRLSGRYGVSHQQIHKDFNRLKAYRRDRAGADAVPTTEFVCEKGVRELMSNEEYAKAIDKQLSYMEWLYDEGVREKAPDKTEHSGDMDVTQQHELSDKDRDLALEVIRQRNAADPSEAPDPDTTDGPNITDQ